MSPLERHALSQEVQIHRLRVEELDATLLDAEENLRQVVNAPEEMVKQLDALRIELRGRRAALVLGAAVLDAHPA